MKYIVTIVFLLISVVPLKAQKNDPDKILSHAKGQTEIMLTNVKGVLDTANPTLVSPRTLENDKLKVVTSRDWTSGFFSRLIMVFI